MGFYKNDWNTLVKGGDIGRLLTSHCKVFQKLGRVLRNNKDYKLQRTMDQKVSYMLDGEKKILTAPTISFLFKEMFWIELMVPLEVDPEIAYSKTVRIRIQDDPLIEILLRNQLLSFPGIEARRYIKIIEGTISLIKASPLEISSLQIHEVDNNVNLNIEIHIPGRKIFGGSKMWLNRRREYPIYEINTLDLPKKKFKKLKGALKEYLFKYPL